MNTSEKSKQTVLAAESSKLAALFYDYVVPIDLSELYEASDNNLLDSLSKRFGSILPEAMRQGNDSLRDARIVAYTTKYLIGNPSTLRFKGFPLRENLPDGETLEARREKLLPEQIGMAESIISESGTINAGIFHSGAVSDSTENKQIALIKVAGIGIIDPEKLRWDQILEFRKDADAIGKLKRFRLFVSANYEGKPKSYIADDLFTRYEDYKNTLNSWDIKLVPGAISATVTDNLTPNLLAGMGTFLASGSLTSAVAAAGCIQVGKITLEIVRRKAKKAEIVSSSPMAYVAELNNLVEKGQQAEQTVTPNA